MALPERFDLGPNSLLCVGIGGKGANMRQVFVSAKLFLEVRAVLWMARVLPFDLTSQRFVTRSVEEGGKVSFGALCRFVATAAAACDD